MGAPFAFFSIDRGLSVRPLKLGGSPHQKKKEKKKLHSTEIITYRGIASAVWFPCWLEVPDHTNAGRDHTKPPVQNSYQCFPSEGQPYGGKS